MNQVEHLLPVFPLRNTVLFPFVVGPFSAGRPISVAAIEAAAASEDKSIAVITQKDIDTDLVQQDQLFAIGVRATIKQMRRSDETIDLVLQGIERIRLVGLDQTEPYLRARVDLLPMSKMEEGTEVEALQQELISLANEYQSKAQPLMTFNIEEAVSQIHDPMQLIYFLAMIPNLDMSKAQKLLETDTHMESMRLLHGYYLHEMEVLKVRKKISGQVQTEMEQQQREYVLRQQMRAIQEELGEKNPEQAEHAELSRQLEEADLPELVRTEAERHLSRLQRLPAAAPDHQLIRTYLELLLELPWSTVTQDNLDLIHARQVLDEDHYGLKEIKERILEHLAVLKLNPEAQAPIICFVGPPGVGKTSLGQSIARALNRKFERFSLGGLHDEAELRGHRRTYIGALPGRIIQAIRRAEVKNPLLMLDEVDKLGRDFRGDPASALLEILDPAQNFEFRDNYLDLPFDLSKTFFILTANALDTIPKPLLDRVEIIRLSGYSDEEKLQIARRYLLERQRKNAGLTNEQLTIPDATLMLIVRRYTREAGVRELERMLGRLARKLALQIAEDRGEPDTIDAAMLSEMLGPKRFFLEQARKALPPGVATGLAWTETGGDVLYIEAIGLPKGEKLTLTGQLGDVMRESAQAAQSYVIAHSDTLGVEDPVSGVHIHVPAGAIPKDGPSAGVTMATALASLYTGQAVRSDTAMTGEITLTGLVLPVGGIKEKILAARRAGIKRVILPKQNEKDLTELPDDVREELQFFLAQRIEDVLVEAIPGLSTRLADTS